MDRNQDSGRRTPKAIQVKAVPPITGRVDEGKAGGPKVSIWFLRPGLPRGQSTEPKRIIPEP